MSEFLCYTEKYRPLFISDILGNEATIEALDSLESLPNMLLYGPPGTGKTTAIRALCRKIYNTKSVNLNIPNVIELNASDERGIKTIRESVKQFASTTLDGKLKLVILDEADSMSRDAQNALRRVIEDFSSNCRFCLIANYANKIIPAIQSRCCKFRFGPITKSNEKILKRIQEICENEQIDYTDEGLNTLIKVCNGDARKLINDIEGAHKTYGKITKENVLQLSNTVDSSIYEILFYDLLRSNLLKMVQLITTAMKENFLECSVLLNNLSELVKESDLENKLFILNELSDVEKRVLMGGSQKIQAMAIAGILFKYRD